MMPTIVLKIYKASPPHMFCRGEANATTISENDAFCLFTKAMGDTGAIQTLEIEIATTTHARSRQNQSKIIVKMMHLAYSPRRWDAHGATPALKIEIATTTHALSRQNKGKIVMKMMHPAYSPERWETQGQPKK